MQQNILFSQNSENYDFSFLNELIELDCFSIVNSNDDITVAENNEKLQKWLQLDEFILLGTGGSSLGARCIYEVSKKSKKIHFMNNLDPFHIKNIFDQIRDFSKVGILCVSKSGETLETITQLLLILQTHANDVSQNIVVITENKPSSLKNIAEENGFLCFDHPKTIGGRFSVFSIVGMLPSIICGMDYKQIREGGRNILRNSLDDIKKGSSFVANNLKKGFSNHVSFIYSDKLIYFGEWLAQLYAESSGKNKVGITPITARGSVDQHSQLQLYMDGTSDKCFSFFLEKQNCDFVIDNAPENFSYITNKKIAEIFEAQYEATKTSVFGKNCPLREFIFAEISPKILGEMFMFFLIETACICKLIKVNPFDQPGVEKGKILTKKLLATGIK